MQKNLYSCGDGEKIVFSIVREIENSVWYYLKFQLYLSNYFDILKWKMFYWVTDQLLHLINVIPHIVTPCFFYLKRLTIRSIIKITTVPAVNVFTSLLIKVRLPANNILSNEFTPNVNMITGIKFVCYECFQIWFIFST